MAFEIPASKGKTEKPPVGNHLAILVALIDMGNQWQEPFKATDNGYYWPRDLYVWELVHEKIAGTDKNHVIAIDLNRSTGDKAKLRKWVEARTGKPIAPDFNPVSELGQACSLNVVANKGGYPVVNGMAAVMKGIPIPKPTYPLTAITLEEFQANENIIPDWVPWLFGSPLAAHIKACEQIGGEKPQPRKKAEAPAGGFSILAPSEGGAEIPF